MAVDLLKNENGFVFLDEANRAYNVRMLDGKPWLCYWNKGCKCFTTLRPITQSETDLYSQYALSSSMASLYFKQMSLPKAGD